MDFPTFTIFLPNALMKPRAYIGEATHVAWRTESKIGSADPSLEFMHEVTLVSGHFLLSVLTHTLIHVHSGSLATASRRMKCFLRLGTYQSF